MYTKWIIWWLVWLAATVFFFCMGNCWHYAWYLYIIITLVSALLGFLLFGKSVGWW